jgi:hypothetical protein
MQVKHDWIRTFRVEERAFSEVREPRVMCRDEKGGNRFGTAFALLRVMALLSALA